MTAPPQSDDQRTRCDRRTARARPAGTARRTGTVLTAVLVLILALAVTHLATGQVLLSPGQVLAALLGTPEIPAHSVIVRDLRLPRTLIAVVAGAALGLAAALLQCLTRNPLADPGLVGVSAGAVLAVVVSLSIGGPGAPGAVIVAVALAGAVLGGLLVAWFGGGAADSERLVVAGVLTTAVLGALSSIVLLVDGEIFAAVLRWVIGSLHGRVWADWNLLWPVAAVAMLVGLALRRPATALMFDPDVAVASGVDLSRVRLAVFGVAAVLSAAAAAVVGGVAFVGLIGAHVARRLVGAHPARLLPAAALVGAALLVGADTLAETLGHVVPTGGVIDRPALPVGALTALIGGPLLLVLLWRRR